MTRIDEEGGGDVSGEGTTVVGRIIAVDKAGSKRGCI